MKGTPFTIEALRKSAVARLNPHLFGDPDKPKAKASKYSAQKTDVDGLPFDSKKEAKRYKGLKLLLKAGKISFLSRQVEFELNVGGTHSLVYIADFTYTDAVTGNQVVEDCKGMLTSVYKKKRRLMKKVHGITILET